MKRIKELTMRLERLIGLYVQETELKDELRALYVALCEVRHKPQCRENEQQHNTTSVIVFHSALLCHPKEAQY